MLKFKFLILTLLISNLTISISFAKASCLDLTQKQAETAVRVSKIAISKGSSLIYQSKNESGLVQPMTIWSEKVKNKKGKASYQMKVDGRSLDLSLVYVARDPSDQRAFNLAWLSGCRPPLGKPTSIQNR
jgi:hypothetical protein